MDLNDLVNDPEISSFLQEFRQDEWKTMLKRTILYGIYSLRALKTVGLRLQKARKVPALKIKLNQLEDFNAIQKLNKGSKTCKVLQPNRSTSHSKIKEKSSEIHSCRHGSQNHSNKSFKPDPRLPAKKLIGREFTQRPTKKKPDPPQILGFNSHTFTVEDKAKDEENSSLSTFNPAEDMKRVFKSDFSKPPDLIPRILRPVELPSHPHNFSSISAQISCISSDISDS